MNNVVRDSLHDCFMKTKLIWCSILCQFSAAKVVVLPVVELNIKLGVKIFKFNCNYNANCKTTLPKIGSNCSIKSHLANVYLVTHLKYNCNMSDTAIIPQQNNKKINNNNCLGKQLSTNLYTMQICRPNWMILFDYAGIVWIFEATLSFVTLSFGWSANKWIRQVALYAYNL